MKPNVCNWHIGQAESIRTQLVKGFTSPRSRHSIWPWEPFILLECSLWNLDIGGWSLSIIRTSVTLEMGSSHTKATLSH